MRTPNTLDPNDGWLPVALPDGTYCHVHVDRERATLDLIVRASEDPASEPLQAIRGLDAAYFVVDVAGFVQAALARPSLELVP